MKIVLVIAPVLRRERIERFHVSLREEGIGVYHPLIRVKAAAEDLNQKMAVR